MRYVLLLVLMGVVGSANAQEMKSILETRNYGTPTLAPPREQVKPADEAKAATDEPKAEVSEAKAEVPEPKVDVTEPVVQSTSPVQTAMSKSAGPVVPQVYYVYVYVPTAKAAPAKSKRELRRSQIPVVPIHWVLSGRHK